MKPRTCILIVTIISLSVFGWRDHRKLTLLREDRDRLSARAAGLGIPEGAIRMSRRPRPDTTAAAKLAAKNFINHHKQREAIKLAGGDPEKSEETAARAFEWMTSLNSKQIRVVIGEILNDPELDDKSRRKLIGQSVRFLSQNDPAGALNLFSGFSIHLKDTGLGRQVVRESLGELAKDNPQAALAWAREHMNEFPIIIKSSQDLLISNTAIQDPALAFEVIREFGTERNDGDAEASILITSSSETRTKAFTAFRQHLASLDDRETRSEVEQQAWTGLAYGIVDEGFESGSKWLTAANPSPTELSSILERIGIGLGNSKKFDQSANWVEWIANTVPAEKGEEPIIEILKFWTKYDREAAGTWLASAPEGPVKNASICGYAEAVFHHDPETAMQWIMTLPPGKGRDTTLKNFYWWWPKDDPAGKEAFALEHGIK